MTTTIKRQTAPGKGADAVDGVQNERLDKYTIFEGIQGGFYNVA
jgi:hypothetical protein